MARMRVCVCECVSCVAWRIFLLILSSSRIFWLGTFRFGKVSFACNFQSQLRLPCCCYPPPLSLAHQVSVSFPSTRSLHSSSAMAQKKCATYPHAMRTSTMLVFTARPSVARWCVFVHKVTAGWKKFWNPVRWKIFLLNIISLYHFCTL